MSSSKVFRIKEGEGDIKKLMKSNAAMIGKRLYGVLYSNGMKHLMNPNVW